MLAAGAAVVAVVVDAPVVDAADAAVLLEEEEGAVMDATVSKRIRLVSVGNHTTHGGDARTPSVSAWPPVL